MKTIGELVAQSPARSRVFEKYGIDYCCGGRATLEEACRERGLDVGAIEAELEGLGRDREEIDWGQANSAALVIAHIVQRYHEPLHAELKRLDALVSRVARVHGNGHPELHLLRNTWQALRSDLDLHLAKEEQVLFPWIQELQSSVETGRQAPRSHAGCGPFEQMEAEHRETAEALTQMRTITGGYLAPADACGSFRALYDGLREFEEELHRHIHLENSVLHPMSRKLVESARLS